MAELVNDELKMMGKEAVMTQFEVRLMKTMKNLCQDS
jgi:hypothetical protein